MVNVSCCFLHGCLNLHSSLSNSNTSTLSYFIWLYSNYFTDQWVRVCVPDGRTDSANTPPDGLVKGCTQDLVVVLGEAQTGHPFVVGMLESAQA